MLLWPSVFFYVKISYEVVHLVDFGKALKIFFVCIVYSMEQIHHNTRPKMRQAIIQVSSQNVEYGSLVFPCYSTCHVWVFWQVWTIFWVFYLFFSFDQVRLSPNTEKYCQDCRALSCFWKVLIEKMIVLRSMCLHCLTTINML